VPREFFWRRFLPVGLTLTGLKSSSPRARILIYISQVCYCNSMKICGVFTALFPAMVSVGDCAAAVFSFDEKAVREIKFHRAASAIDRLRGRRLSGSAEYRPSLTLPQNYSHCLCYWFKAINRLRPRPGSMAVALRAAQEPPETSGPQTPGQFAVALFVGSVCAVERM